MNTKCVGGKAPVLKGGRVPSVQLCRKSHVPFIGVIGLTFYFLSVGPASRLMYRRDASRWAARTFEIVYAPVIWLQGHTPLNSLIYRYVSWWGGIDY
jgi:hypothetical protein